MKFRTKLLFLMRLTTLLILAASLHVSAAVHSQQVSYKVKNAPLATVLTAIEKQTGYVFIYNDKDLAHAAPVTIDLKAATLEKALNEVLKDQPLTWQIKGSNTVVISAKPSQPVVSVGSVVAPESPAPPTVHGRITNEKGEPVAGVNISIKGGKVIGVTNENGEFTLNNIADNAVLVFNAISIETFETKLNGRTELALSMKTKVSSLDEVQIIAYGQTSKRLNTGNVSTVKSETISQQPVTNPLAALAARVPGLMITQSNGNPGAAVNVQIRGINSLAQGSSPLFIIDGIPFNNSVVGANYSGIQMANAGQNPFSTINPADIESIDILKDADATAIYGSRGANGVVLITMKKGIAGKAAFTMNINAGAAAVPEKLSLLGTSEYVAMRREAFKNDGIVPITTSGTGYAPDLLLWDTLKYTDWQKKLIGGTAFYHNANASFSGGNEAFQFYVSGNYSRQTSVYPGDFSDNRISLNSHINYASLDKRLRVNFAASFSNDLNQLLRTDLTQQSLTLIPNNPDLQDASGNLVWSKNGADINNPMGLLLQKSQATTDNFLSSLNLSYRLIDNLRFELSSGISRLKVNNQSILPIASFNPSTGPTTGSANFSDARSNNWILEPQLKYNTHFDHLKMEIMLGYTAQKTGTYQNFIAASGFTNDAVLTSVAFAPSITAQTTFSDYRYQAMFARVNLNYNNKYILNVTGRRDGSTRFAPENQWANFGAAGGAWIFSEEPFLQKISPVLSYGKLRASYGITGNDQIGDYQYLDNYSAYSIYQGVTSTYPTRLYNPEYGWETNRKFEAGIELGFFSDRILLSASYFNNRSSDQLVNYKLPDQTGFPSVLKNFGALVQNTGLEFQLSSVNLKNGGLSWYSDINLTINRNKLVSFPDLESSSYANLLVIGQPINIRKLFVAQGVNPTTGLYQYTGTTDQDRTYALDLTPRFFGGLNNRISYGNFEFSILFQFVKQQGLDYKYAFNQPGVMSNQPTDVLGRWQKAGDITDIQRFAVSGTAAYGNYTKSSANMSDASFIRLKNAALYYTFPISTMKKLHLTRARVYMQAQNLATLTSFKGLEPEYQGLNNSLPLLRAIIAGIEITL